MSAVAFVAALAAAAVFLSRPAEAPAHIRFSNGTFVFNYWTKGDEEWWINNCSQRTKRIDPVGTIVWQYGEVTRMFNHLEDETHFGSNWLGGSQQYLCHSLDDGQNWAWFQAYWNEQTGHGNAGTRAHFRMFFAPHPHADHVHKWSVIEPHHETLVCCPNHRPDEPWELWASHVALEMNPHHNIYWDHFYRWPPGMHRGWFHNGYQDRIGGLHDGQYWN